jgi:hypothetical protein
MNVMNPWIGGHRAAGCLCCRVKMRSYDAPKKILIPMFPKVLLLILVTFIPETMKLDLVSVHQLQADFKGEKEGATRVRTWVSGKSSRNQNPL